MAALERDQVERGMEIHGPNQQARHARPCASCTSIFVLISVSVLLVGLVMGFSIYLIMQGRICSGGGWDLDPNKDPYLKSGKENPSASLLLQNIRSCELDGRWRTEDVEGRALTSMWLAMGMQIFAIALLVLN